MVMTTISFLLLLFITTNLTKSKYDQRISTERRSTRQSTRNTVKDEEKGPHCEMLPEVRIKRYRELLKNGTTGKEDTCVDRAVLVSDCFI